MSRVVRDAVARRRPYAQTALEVLEGRWLLSASVKLTIPWNVDPFAAERAAAAAVKAHTNVVIDAVSPSATSPPGSALTPSQMRQAYGLDQVMFGSVAGDGTGQTIAIIDAFHYPTAFGDLSAFSVQFGLPLLNQFTGASTTAPYFRQVAEDGSTNFPANDTTGGWEVEEALDIEWAHAIAPNANIMLVEANSAGNNDLISNAVNWARAQPGVVAVSMSFSGGEFGGHRFGETSYDQYFTTPTGHAGVSFLAATGDGGAIGQGFTSNSNGGYPCFSPNVVAVGGTTLSLSGGNYGSESGWSGGGGGLSAVEAQPSYQKGVVTQSSTARANPDVAMDADPSSGVAVYDTFDQPNGPWMQVGGTSLATPMWAALMAIIDQGLGLASRGPLDGRTQLLPALYTLPAVDFHDVTMGGNNGYPAGPGYDLVTGLGTPVANLLIPDLIGAATISGSVYVDANSNGVLDGGESGVPSVMVFLDTNNNGVPDPGEPSVDTGASGAYAFYMPDGTYTVHEVPPAGYVTTSVTVSSAVLAAAGSVFNFGVFRTMIAVGAGVALDVRLDATGTNLQIFNGSSALGTPAYQIALASLPSLTLNDAGTGGAVTVDFGNGAPLPGGSLAVSGSALSGDLLTIVGASPAQAFSATDSQIGLTGGVGSITYSGIDMLHLVDGTYYYSGTLSTVQALFVDNQATLVWS